MIQYCKVILICLSRISWHADVLHDAACDILLSFLPAVQRSGLHQSIGTLWFHNSYHHWQIKLTMYFGFNRREKLHSIQPIPLFWHLFAFAPSPSHIPFPPEYEDEEWVDNMLLSLGVQNSQKKSNPQRKDNARFLSIFLIHEMWQMEAMVWICFGRAGLGSWWTIRNQFRLQWVRFTCLWC